MNKYHKYKSELGKLPGWVKVGAVALGVGVGAVHVPGGGSKVWAGKYVVVIKKSGNSSRNSGGVKESVFEEDEDFRVWDVDNSDEGRVVFTRYYNDSFTFGEVEPCASIKDCKLHTFGFSLQVGSFCFSRICGNESILLSGGTDEDTLQITSEQELAVTLDAELRGKGLFFCEVPYLSVDGKVFSSGLLLRRCKCRTGKCAVLRSTCFLVSDSYIDHFGAIECVFAKIGERRCVVPHASSSLVMKNGCNGIRKALLHACQNLSEHRFPIASCPEGNYTDLLKCVRKALCIKDLAPGKYAFIAFFKLNKQCKSVVKRALLVIIGEKKEVYEVSQAMNEDTGFVLCPEMNVTGGEDVVFVPFCINSNNDDSFVSVQEAHEVQCFAVVR